jgi:hypothetical protein
LASLAADEIFHKNPAEMFPPIPSWRELYFYHRMSQVFADLLAPRFNPGVTERNWNYGSSNFLPKVFLGSARFKATQREQFIKWHSDYSSRFSWNDLTRPRVIPMLQGTSEAAVWQICQQGFGVVGTTDDGFYGAGIYFTSKLAYADKYAKTGPEGTKPFLVSMAIPGNSFPVVEHPWAADGFSVNPAGFKGKGCRGGYQSHFILVDGRNINTAFPIRGAIDPGAAADELVTFESAQALPLFVFYSK